MTRSTIPAWLPPRFILDRNEPVYGDYYAPIEDVDNYLKTASPDPGSGWYVDWPGKSYAPLVSDSGHAIPELGSRAFRFSSWLFRWSMIPRFYFLSFLILALLSYYAWHRSGYSEHGNQSSDQGDFAWFLILSLGSVVFALTGLLSLKIRNMMSND